MGRLARLSPRRGCGVISAGKRTAHADSLEPAVPVGRCTAARQIEAGIWPARSVPSERVLSERYRVSRMTARHALETLALEGYLYRNPRRGTFVAEPRLRFSVGSFTRA